MTNLLSISLLLALLIVPELARAEVRITEIAWMGSEGNANAEWIELGNDGAEAVALSGWKITSSSGVPDITLTGAIPAGGYYLLTRTSTSILSGVTGDQAYTGALSNGGATLTLSNSEGSTIDTVVGGSNWSAIGGDNGTKFTPQRTDAGTWVTAAPTPKAHNAQSGSSVANASTTPSDTTPIATSTPSPSINGSVPVIPATPYRPIYIYAGAPRVVTTHAPTPFEAVVYDLDKQIHHGVSIRWNFGDGTNAEGSSVVHAYAHAGTYLVVIRTEEGGSSVISTLTVVVQDAHLTLAEETGGIALTNTGTELADLSEWRLMRGAGMFTIPVDTAILGGSTVTFPHTVTGLGSTTGMVSLVYPTGEVAGSASPPEPPPAPVVAHRSQGQPTVRPATIPEEPPAPVPVAPVSSVWPTSLFHLLAASVTAFLPLQ